MDGHLASHDNKNRKADPPKMSEGEAAGEEVPMVELTLKIGCGKKLGDVPEEWPSRVGLQFPGEEAEITTETVRAAFCPCER